MTLQPLADWVLVRIPEKETETKTNFGLVLIDNDDDESLPKGEVVSVGPGSPDQNGQSLPMWVKPGDKVYFAPNVGFGHKDGDVEYRFLNMRTGQVLAIDE